MRDQRVVNTLWIIIPSLMAVAMSGRSGGVEIVARGLPRPPIALATEQRPASVDGFLWKVRSAPGEHWFRARDGRAARVTVPMGEALLWCRQVGEAVYWLTGQGSNGETRRACVVKETPTTPSVLRQGPSSLAPAASFLTPASHALAWPPCVIDPPYILRRAPLNGGPTRIARADLPSASVFVMRSGAVCYADRDGIHRSAWVGRPGKLICRRSNCNVTAWGAAGETLYWIEEAMPGAREPVGSCRLVALPPQARQPLTIAWALDALTDLAVSGSTVAWYHPAGRALEGVLPDGQVTVLARDIDLATTPVPAGDHLFYLCEQRGGARALATTSMSRGGRDLLARLDGSAQILGAAADGLYVSEEEGSRWLSHRPPTGRLLRLPLPK